MAKSSTHAASSEQLKRFHPLDLISDEHLETLQGKTLVTRVKAGDFLIQPPRNPALSYYLMSGKAEVTLAKYDVREVVAGDMHAYKALDEKLPSAGKVRALTDCHLLQLNRELVEELLTRSQGAEYNVVEFVPTLTAVDISSDDESGWMDRLLEMPFTKNLSAADIRNLFALLEEQVVVTGEAVIKSGEYGEYFYILKSGSAEVVTHGGKTFPLGPGNFFGEQALVADAVRSATVVMTSDGVLGRLHKSHFNNILKKALIQYTDLASLEATQGDRAEPDYQVLDVRLKVEFRHGHHPGATNIPISHLRNQLPKLDHNKLYVVDDTGDRRGELAAYMLRQAGFGAYILKDSQCACA